ncbi:MAG TPA: VIT1/CCC1 transporter family protein [Planctomycetota bacterium]
MTDQPLKSSRRVLDPTERVSEGIFGLIMVLTFTGSLSVAEAGRDDVRTMLIGALGCNIAWGIIDGLLYLMACLADRARQLAVLRAIRGAADPKQVQQSLAPVLPGFAAILEPSELAAIRQRALQLPEPAARATWHREDWLGALGVFLLVFLTTFPVALPFLFMPSVGPALRVSNVIAIVMLFLLGCTYGRTVGHRPWLVGIAMVVLGTALVGMTMALGG